MSSSRRELTDEEKGILELYGQIIGQEDHDWHDVDWLEEFVLSKYDRETAMEALKGVMEEVGVMRKEYGRSARTPGEMMHAFIRSRAERFVVNVSDLICHTNCPRCLKDIDYRIGVPMSCPHCGKEIHSLP